MSLPPLVARLYPPPVARPYPPPVARLYPPPVSRPHLKRFRSSEHYGLCNGQLDEFTTFFKCHVSMHGCRHIRPWLIKFSNVILNCVMLSHLIIFMEVSPTQEEQTLRWLTFKCKITKLTLVMLLKYTPVTQNILCFIFFMCLATMHHETTVDRNLKTICSLWFYHTCDLEIRSRSANPV